MATAVDHAREEFAAIRTGRANPAMFNHIMVDYYGAMTPLQQLATFQVPEARTVLIAPYDKSSVNEVEKAVRDSDLGVNPSSDGNIVRCVLPALTEDRRKEYIKLAKAKAEEGRIAVRSIRRSSNDVLKKQEKDKEITEDQLTRSEKELDQVTKKHVDQIDALLKAKESELLEV
ncbi:ribosome recycling factor [Acidipropionibacterium jensenii]|nr:ribosome recycling factor [Acidipropionibacterium jensenii]MDN5978185.1 ribosome recycling factor [Acidipropionibacterium jensenii]MDN5996017.1 ribosome recycling factor [Acidipropionibacterium jensenii]MDN6021870.1 ribosome recycling factor [Acidipropionibacterium jensenii]MDN6427337.1 ribosome recycling factor [Acidipropionibacterium jensenii]MDN6441782.1 ribosome recycling factor [Acidipropionibacterium jensenii]